MVNDEFRIPILGEDGWEGGYKLEIFTVPRVWDSLRHLLGALGGGTGFHAGGTWKNDGRIHYDEDSEKITFVHDDPYTVNFVISVGASIAYSLKEEAILCVFHRSDGGWVQKLVITEEEFTKHLPDLSQVGKYEDWCEWSPGEFPLPPLSLVMTTAVACECLESSIRSISRAKKKLRKLLPDLDFDDAIVAPIGSQHSDNRRVKRHSINIGHSIDIAFAQIDGKVSLGHKKEGEESLLNVSELLARA